MSDFPELGGYPSLKNTIGTASRGSAFGDHLAAVIAGAPGGGTWPTNNAAIYMPVLVPEVFMPVQALIIVTTQSGNVDVGLYREDGGKVWSAGSTAVAAAGVQAFTVTAGTVLVPGLYWMAMACSTTVAAFDRYAPANTHRPLPLMSQLTALPLPDPITPAAAGASYYPILAFHGQAS